MFLLRPPQGFCRCVPHQLSVVEPETIISPTLNRVILTMDVSAAWKSCSKGLLLIGEIIRLLNARDGYEGCIPNHCQDRGWFASVDV